MPAAPSVPGLPPAALAAEQQILPDRIAAHTRFLSDDLLEGRGPGTRGGRLAALYMQTQFALLGLEPAGEAGGWTQAVPMVNIATRPESIFAFSTGGEKVTLSGGTEYTVTNQTAQPVVDVHAAPIVFVGFGIHAPALGWDDYAGVDMKGKVALILVSQPPSPEPSASGTPHTPFTGKALTYYGRWTYKYEEAARQGAVGAILVHQTTMASYPWSVIGTRWGTETAYLASGTEARVPLAAWVQFAVAEKLLAANHLDLTQLIVKARTPGFRAQPLTSTLSAHVVSTVTPFTGQNVIAKLPGTPANHAAILYTAHFDHLGIDRAAHGDQIYNGAIDNASADGMLLEVARGFADAARKGGIPPGPVYFAAVDAEEQGLLGSEYLAQHPPVPVRQIALNLNFEGIFIMPGGIPQQLMVSGAERTSFLPEVESTAKTFGMSIIPDPFPAAGYFYRSDHFSFARGGVPAFSIGAGNQFEGHDLAYGQATAADYIAHRYHQPSDEFNPHWDLRAQARLAQLSITLGWQALLSTQPIVWNKGDEFEAPRLRSQQR